MGPAATTPPLRVRWRIGELEPFELNGKLARAAERLWLQPGSGGDYCNRHASASVPVPVRRLLGSRSWQTARRTTEPDPSDMGVEFAAVICGVPGRGGNFGKDSAAGVKSDRLIVLEGDVHPSLVGRRTHHTQPYWTYESSPRCATATFETYRRAAQRTFGLVGPST
jgi:hypothetical protein